MAVTSHVFPAINQALDQKAISLSADTLAVLLIASTSAAYTWNSTSQGHSTVANFLAGSGAGALTEVSTSGTGYTRQNLSGVAVTTTALVTMLDAVDPAWASSTISATYALFYDNALSTDATRPIIAYWDFGGTMASTSGTFTLQLSASGIMSQTAS